MISYEQVKENMLQMNENGFVLNSTLNVVHNEADITLRIIPA